MNEKMKFGDKIAAEMVKSISENLFSLITGGITAGVIIILSVTLLFYLFSKVRNPVSIKVPLIISLVAGLVFSGGFISAAMLPLYLKIGKWNEFMTAVSILSYFGFIAYSMLIASWFGKRALGKYSENISEKGLILGIRNMPDGGTAINPKWFFMDWKSLFTNALVLGGIGSGKTSAVLLKTVQQILMMKEKRPAVFVLDIKGDLYETVRLWNHERHSDLVCYGYGYEPVNILGTENILKTVNNLSKGFEFLDESGSKVSYYQEKQKDYLKFVIKLLQYFCNRPGKLETNAYLYNRYIKYKSDSSKSFWLIMTTGTKLQDMNFSATPSFKNQPVSSDTKEFLETMKDHVSLVTADDFTISDIFTLLSDVNRSNGFFYYCREYLAILKEVPEFSDIYGGCSCYSDFQNALADYRNFIFDKDFEKNTSGLKFPLSTLSDESISKYFNARGKAVDFRKDIDEGKIIFVNVPEGDLGSEVARLVGIQFLFQYISTLNRRNSIMSEMSKDRPVFILIDEFFKFINKEIMSFTSTSRSAKAVNILLGQSLGQFPEEYRESLKSNLRTKIVFSIGDEVTAESMSRYLGEKIISRRSSSRSFGPNGSTSQGQSEQSDRKIKVHDLIELKPFMAATSHFDGEKTVPAEIVSFPAWFQKGFNIFPVEYFILKFGKLETKKALEFLQTVRSRLKKRKVKMSELTVSENTIFFSLSYTYMVDESAVQYALSEAGKCGKYRMQRFSCSYDELLDRKRKQNIPKPNVATFVAVN